VASSVTNDNTKIQFYTIEGILIFEQNISKNIEHIDLSNLQSGTYFAVIVDGNPVKFNKILILK